MSFYFAANGVYRSFYQVEEACKKRRFSSQGHVTWRLAEKHRLGAAANWDIAPANDSFATSL